MADTDKTSIVSDDIQIIQTVNAYFREAEEGRKTRMRKNKANREAFVSQQDFTNKIAGQSTEFLPKLSIAAEQFGAFIKKGLVQFGDWFTVELAKDIENTMGITGEDVRKLLMHFLDNLYDNENKRISLSIRVSDGVKQGALESLMIFKVHDHMIPETIFEVDPDDETKLKPKIVRRWGLRVDPIRAEDYYPDPTGRGLYEIHHTERDLFDVVDLARRGIYDQAAVNKLSVLIQAEGDDARKEIERGQNETTPPGIRKKVQIDECWGTLLDKDGKVLIRNAVVTIANKKVILRKPMANPLWHGRSPFVATPLLRVPHSVWHKALYDDARGLNLALNELFNLMLDGGLAEVWGIKQVHPDFLENPESISGGIAQGDTLTLREGIPPEARAIEVLNTGRVPGEAMAMYNLLDKEFNASALTNDIKLGLLPSKQVKATEIVEASQSQAITLDSIVADVETELLTEMLKRSWLLMLQNMNDFDARVIIDLIGSTKALALAQLSPAQRYSIFARGASFKVSGLSSTLSRARDFQKIMAFIQAAGSNPLLLQAFVQRFSADKFLTQIMKFLNLDPSKFEKSEEELAGTGEQVNQMGVLQGIVGGGGGGSLKGESGIQAQVNQEIKPSET